MTVSELAERYIEALDAGLIMGKGGRPNRPSTIYVNKGQLRGHILPLIGQRRVQDLTKSRCDENDERRHRREDEGG